MEKIMALLLEIIVVIALLLFICNIEISDGFKITLHTWWRGLGVLIAGIGIGIYLVGERKQAKEEGYEKGYKDAIETIIHNNSKEEK